MVVGVEPSIYVWNADIAESALRQHQGQGAIDGDDDDDKNDDDNSWNEWEDLKAEARQAPIIIEGEVGLRIQLYSRLPWIHRFTCP